MCVSSHQILIVLNTYKCYRMSSERALRALKCSGRFCCCPIINEFIMLSTMLTNWYFNAAKFSMPFCWVVSVSIYLYVLHGRLEILLLVDVAWRKHHHPATANSSPAPPPIKNCFASKSSLLEIFEPNIQIAYSWSAPYTNKPIPCITNMSIKINFIANCTRFASKTINHRKNVEKNTQITDELWDTNKLEEKKKHANHAMND